MTKRPQSSSRFAQVGILTAIPFVLLVGPVIGYYLGTALDARWRYAPWGTALGIVVGLLASARVTSQLIRQAQDRRTRWDDPTT